MRKIYFIVALIIISCLQSIAQYKTIFPTDSITWVQTIEVIDGAFNERFTYNGQEKTINGKIYYELESSYNFSNFIHEDLLNGNTWLLEIDHNNDTTETLIMDFNLLLGDSIIYRRNYRDTTYAIVTKLDSIGNRKVIEFDNPRNHLTNTPLKFIEGIGPNYGFGFFDQYTQVLCKLYYQDDLVYALDTLHLTCPTFSDVETFGIGQSISIYPNLAQTHFFVEQKDANLLSHNLRLYDVFGKLLLIEPLINNKQQINISTLDAHILLYQIRGDKYHFTGRLFKH